MATTNYITRINDNNVIDARMPSDSHASIGFSGNVSDTALGGPNAPEKVTGTYVLYSVKNFTANASGDITYTYDKNAFFHLQSVITARASGVQLQKYNFYFGLNGSILNESKDTEYLDNQDENVRSPGLSAIIELTKNDVVAVFVENTESGQDALIENISIAITQV